jgi:hypothetical protein
VHPAEDEGLPGGLGGRVGAHDHRVGLPGDDRPPLPLAVASAGGVGVVRLLPQFGGVDHGADVALEDRELGPVVEVFGLGAAQQNLPGELRHPEHHLDLGAGAVPALVGEDREVVGIANGEGGLLDGGVLEVDHVEHRHRVAQQVVGLDAVAHLDDAGVGLQRHLPHREDGVG